MGLTKADASKLVAKVAGARDKVELGLQLHRACIPLMRGEASESTVLGVLEAAGFTKEEAVLVLGSRNANDERLAPPEATTNGQLFYNSAPLRGQLRQRPFGVAAIVNVASGYPCTDV